MYIDAQRSTQDKHAIKPLATVRVPSRSLSGHLSPLVQRQTRGGSGPGSAAEEIG